MSDNTGGARLATEHLLALGHRRFGYLMPPPRNVDAPARLAGVRAALREAGCPADALTIAHGDALVGGGEAAAIELLERAPDTTAIVAYNDLMAIGVMHSFLAAGVKVPQQVSVVGFDDILTSRLVLPTLTTVAAPMRQIGVTAVTNVLAMLKGAIPAGGDALVMPTQLRVRGSTGPRRRTRTPVVRPRRLTEDG